MFYDIAIHPSRIELIRRYFSPDKNNQIEKKLGYKDIDFKFGVNTIENGENYEKVKRVITDLIEPHKNELNSVNIIAPSSFFRFKEFPFSKNNLEFEEYILWEAYQMATDVPEHYKFGYTHSEKEGKIIVALVRKTVYNFFKELFYDIYSDSV